MKKRYDIYLHINLYLGISLGLFAVWLLKYNSQRQFVIIIAIATYYLVWGHLYHYLKKDLDRRVVIEYLLIAAISILAGYLVFAS